MRHSVLSSYVAFSFEEARGSFEGLIRWFLLRFSEFSLHVPDDSMKLSNISADVDMTFLGDNVSVPENQSLNVCLRLSNVSEPTETSLWVNVTSVDGFAAGKKVQCIYKF